jgi:IS30 family transposase
MNTGESRPRKHLDHEKRVCIERGLCEGRTLTAIARSIGVHISTVRREIIRNRRCDGASYAKGADRTDCAHLRNCKVKSICDFYCEKRLCKRCEMRKCQDICQSYEMRTCMTVENAPFVCNACEHFARCTLTRYRYSADIADVQALHRSKEARAGVDLTEDEMGVLVDAVRDGLAKGQSIHHIFATSDLPCSERSFYRHVENQDIPIKSIDLAKKVKYKKRRRQKAKSRETGFFRGHEYDDYLALPEEDQAGRTEVDTVIGKRSDRQCILSLHRVDLHFQIYLLLRDKTEASVIEAFNWLEECCDGKFHEFFGLLLLDRGAEFNDIAGMEHSCKGDGLRCATYFTDPNRPDQKGSCEKNHVELRKILPKGTPFDALDAFTLAQICSHVNSSVRKGCGNISPMQMAMLVLPESLLNNLGLRLIPPKEVVSAPNILYRP